MNREWFKIKDPQFMKVQFKDPKSKKDSTVEFTITDTDVIQRFTRDIASTPTEGPMMIKMDGSKTVQLALIFSHDDPDQAKENDTINFYNGMIKTPSTGFHDSQAPAIKKLYADILSLIKPAYDKPTLKVKSLPIKFEHFTFTYTKHVFRDGKPATVSFDDDFYSVQAPKSEPALELKVTSGQIAPEDLEFKIANSTFVLMSYQTKNKERLYPLHFAIKKKR